MTAIQTVTGIIDSSQLGITLMHEHFIFDRSLLWKEPIGLEKSFAHQKVEMSILGKLRLNPFSNYDNCILNDEETAIKEVRQFYNRGGNSIVDVTIDGIGRNPKALCRISRATGLNIVMGSGFYIHETHPKRVQEFSIEKIKEEIIIDLTVGVHGTDIKSGIIGEIGIGDNMTDREIKVLRGAARAQKETNAVLSIHLPGKNKYGHQVLDIIEQEGGNLNKTILGHMNHLLESFDYQKSLIKRGAFIEFDMIGMDFWFPEGQSPSDEQNAKGIVKLIDKGYIKQILLSQDVFMKIMLKKFGGWGYSHILENFIPRLKEKGVNQDEINQLLVTNPQLVFSK